MQGVHKGIFGDTLSMGGGVGHLCACQKKKIIHKTVQMVLQLKMEHFTEDGRDPHLQVSRLL